jgi:hypothetical protein
MVSESKFNIPWVKLATTRCLTQEEGEGTIEGAGSTMNATTNNGFSSFFMVYSSGPLSDYHSKTLESG